MNNYTEWYISGCGLTIHRQATPPVEAVTVLADDCLQKPHLHELHKHHMCGGGDGLASSGCLNVSTSALPVSAQLPLTRPCNNDTSCSTKKVSQWSLIKTSLQRNCTTKVQLVEIMLTIMLGPPSSLYVMTLYQHVYLEVYKQAATLEGFFTCRDNQTQQ